MQEIFDELVDHQVVKVGIAKYLDFTKNKDVKSCLFGILAHE